MSLRVVAGGVAAPGAPGCVGDPSSGVLGVAEHPGDHGRGGLEDELADRGGPAVRAGEAEETQALWIVV